MLFRTATVPAQGAGSALRGSEGLHFFKLRFSIQPIAVVEKKTSLWKVMACYGRLGVHGRHPWKWHIKSSHSSD